MGCSHAESPEPKVVLRYRDGDYHIAADQMSTSPPSEEELAAISEALANHEGWEKGRNPAPMDFTMAVLELIYAGNREMAWRLFDTAWPENVPGKDDYRSQLEREIKWSPYWAEVAAMDRRK